MADPDPAACAICHPDLGDRQGPHHIGVRFGDAGPGWSVSLDGTDVTSRCVEALAGDPGWVVLMVPSRVCTGPIDNPDQAGHLHAERLQGLVAVTRVQLGHS